MLLTQTHTCVVWLTNGCVIDATVAIVWLRRKMLKPDQTIQVVEHIHTYQITVHGYGRTSALSPDSPTTCQKQKTKTREKHKDTELRSSVILQVSAELVHIFRAIIEQIRLSWKSYLISGCRFGDLVSTQKWPKYFACGRHQCAGGGCLHPTDTKAKHGQFRWGIGSSPYTIRKIAFSSVFLSCVHHSLFLTLSPAVDAAKTIEPTE